MWGRAPSWQIIFSQHRHLLVMRPCTRFNSIQTNLKVNPVENSSLTKQFRIRLDGERFATVDYETLNNSAYDLIHAAIPEEYQGLGLGRILAERVFEHIASDNKKIKVTCEFLLKFYSENQEKYSSYIIDTILGDTK